ncbi:Rho GTPase activation protein [Gongronella butleri]|nr:Rho GTPase activation protein [Gongronella butleri]
MTSLDTPGVVTANHKALIRSWWKKVSAAHPKAHLFKEMKVPVVEHGVFGVPLQKSITYASSSISYVDDNTGEHRFGQIPTIIAKCGSFLKEEALHVEGIFRLPGNAKRIRLLQTLFDTPDTYGAQLDWCGYSVHDAASIMRRFLNFLPESVITLDFYEPFKKAMDAHYPSEQDKVDAFQDLIEALPLPNQYLLLYLLDLLALFAAAVNYTKMASECLAAVFVPGILSHPDDAVNPSRYKHSQKVVQFLIDHQEKFFIPRSNMSAHTDADQAPSAAVTSTAPSLPDRETIAGRDLMRSKSQHTLSNCSNHRASTIYSLTMGSYSGTCLDSLIVAEPTANAHTPTPPLGTNLRRSKTLPSKSVTLSALGSQRQIVHVNRNASHRDRRRGQDKPYKQQFV